MAFALAAVFLRMNGPKLCVGVDEGERFLVEEVIVGKADLSVIASWLEEHIQGDPTGPGSEPSARA